LYHIFKIKRQNNSDLLKIKFQPLYVLKPFQIKLRIIIYINIFIISF